MDGTMRARLFVVIGALLWSAGAQAAEVRGRFSTVAAGYEAPRAGDEVSSYPIYEIVSLEVGRLDLPLLDTSRVVLQGWGRLQAGDDELSDSSGDLGLLYFEGRSGPFTLRLGRQHVAHGVGRMALIDGVDTGLQLDFGLGLQGFFGATVNREFEYDRGDWQGGGRLFYRFPGPGEVGAAYRHTRREGSLAFEEVAFDGLYRVGPTRWLALAALSPRDTHFIEGRLAVTVDVIDTLAITVDAERTDPAMFIPRTSIFSVFADAPHDALGGDIRWEPSPFYTLDVAGRALLLDGESLGYDTLLRFVTYREPARLSRIGAEVRRLDESDNAYLRGRALTALQVRDPIRVAADAFVYRYDEPINGEDLALLGQASLVYDIAPSLRLAGTATVGTTPLASVQFEGLIRFEYGLNMDLSREVGP
jgi:hypothetical protein